MDLNHSFAFSLRFQILNHNLIHQPLCEVVISCLKSLDDLFDGLLANGALPLDLLGAPDAEALMATGHADCVDLLVHAYLALS